MNKFITLEGGEGAGKSTVIPFIKEYLEALGQDVLLTREPGGSKLAEDLRHILLNQEMDVMTETLLIFASRCDHINNVIRPALNEDKWVICDRFTDATMAYQSSAKGLSEGIVRGLQDIVQKEVVPGLTFVLDVPLAVSKERKSGAEEFEIVNNQEHEFDKFALENDDFKLKVLHGYKSVVKKNPQRCKLIDTSLSLEDTKEQVLLMLQQYCKKVLLA